MMVAAEPSLSSFLSANDNPTAPTDDWQDALEDQAVVGGVLALDDVEKDEEVTEQFHNNDHGLTSSRQSLVSMLREEDEDGDGTKQGRRRHCQCCRRWPRVCVVFVGILLPLWLLIAISVGLGSWLAVLELPGEIKHNNNVMRARMEAKTLTNVVVHTTASIPRICWELFLQQNEAKINRTLLGELLAISILEVEAEYENSTNMDATTPFNPLHDDIIILNTTELEEFMINCGSTAEPYVRKLLDRAVVANEVALGERLTFNWMRCTNATFHLPVNRDEILPQIRHEGQEEFYSNAWTAHQEKLYELYLSESPNTTQGRVDAYEESLLDATGGDDCYTNRAASCWFWFTVMTTMGYGNQAPTTAGGRGLVFTLGFVSILLFGAMLARAGNIASVILDTAISRVKLIQRRHVANALCWGAIWVSWMFFMAFTTRQWNRERLGADNDFTFGDGYWFAYISTTTVGLGDYFLEPEVLLLSELFSFSAIFLAGFTFLSAFLNGLSPFFERERRTFVDELLDTIKDKQD